MGIAVGNGQADPFNIATLVSEKLIQQSYSSPFWDYAYGPSIAISAMYEVSSYFKVNLTRALDRRLLTFMTNNSWPAYNILNNITMPFDGEVGDHIGLFPIAFLARGQYYNLSNQSDEWRIAVETANMYVVPFTPHLADGTFSRATGWAGEPPGTEFLWCDDGFMGLALLTRLARAGAPLAVDYVNVAAVMQLHYMARFQNPTSGLYYHGYNAASGSPSCCAWSRANGWQMMSAVETMLAVVAVSPSSPLLPQLLAALKSHADALVAVQSADGRWHQVLDDPSTFLETSVTAMTIYALCTAVNAQWLDRATYDASIQLAWSGMTSQVAADGTVDGICEGTGVETSVAAYEARGTDYTTSAPGIGSVLRAAIAYAQYTQAAAV